MIRLLLVDDQSIFRQGLATLLSIEDDIEIVGEASHGNEAIQIATQLQPDVILMDVRMPICDGVTATREILERFPWMKVLVLTTFEDDEYIWESLKAGALGYILKRTPPDLVANSIRCVYLGYSQLGPTIASKVLSQLKAKASISATNYQQLFSKREFEILKLLAQGKNNQEIAQILHITEGTIKNYITNILSILSQFGVRDRIGAALWARQNLLE